MGVSRRTIQRCEQEQDFKDYLAMRGKKPEQVESDWTDMKRRERTRIDLLAARAAVRRVVTLAEELGGLPQDEWNLLHDLHAETQAYLYPHSVSDED